ncbi:jg11393 [Pararge aegeria aegeria]|uniref:Jg11393 protein n=1 Tax=Pararge aegeria aegeria TaxID=348720 RepID=A0A8S4REI4_9NEOP|nr:jg11393 [Pararge aegeria aegeria]
MASVNTKKCVVNIDPKLYCCRICLDTKYTKGINLVKSSHILELLEYCVGFTVDIQRTSHVLCVKCKNKIQEFEEFKKKCVKSESLWKKFPILNYPKSYELEHNDDLTKLIKEEQVDAEDQECEDLNTEELCTDENIENHHEKDSEEINNTKQSLVINNEPKSLPKIKTEDNNCNVKCEVETKTNECPKCKKIYNNKKWLWKHMKSCNDYLKKKRIRKIVVKTENGNATLSSNECGLCNRVFSCNIKQHMKQHWLNNHLQCELCNYIGKDFAHMLTHRYSHYPNMKLRCIACDKKGVSMLSLQFHFRAVHLQKPGGYCTFCDKTFNKFKTWKRHHRMHTESNHLYVCDHCGKKFLYRHEIKTHLINHSDTRQYVCETCGKGFRRVSSLRDHINNLHKAREPAKCEHCNKVYKSANNLKIHLRNLTIEKPFICEVCSRNFYTEAILKKHMFWHTNERPFSCEVCGQKYKAKAQLKVHMRKHSGALPYDCVTCGKGFPSSNQLKRHKSVHTGVRAYKCVHCERSFHAKKRLLEHAAGHKSASGDKLET